MGKIWNKIIATGICIAVAVGGGITLNHFLSSGNQFASLPNENQVVLNVDRFQADERLMDSVDNAPVRFVADKNGINVVMEAGLINDYVEGINSSVAYMNNIFAQVNSSYVWNVAVDGVDGASLEDADIKIVHQDLSEGDTGGFVGSTAGEIKINEETNNQYNYITNGELVITNHFDSCVESFYESGTPSGISEYILKNLVHNNFTAGFLDVMGMKTPAEPELEGKTYLIYSDALAFNNKIFVKDMKVLCSLYGDTARYGYEKFENLFSNNELVRDPIQVEEQGMEQ